MGLLGDMLQGGAKGIMEGVGSLAVSLRTAFTGEEPLTSDQQLELLTQVNKLEQMTADLEAIAAQGQIDLNKLDAQSNSLLKGGWRPALGWCCALGFFYSFLLKPLLPWCVGVILQVVNQLVDKPIYFVVPSMPSLDGAELTSLTFALLGMGGIRMVEKLKGVASK